MDFVTPKQIISPISGQPVNPRIIELRSGNKIIKEAHWIDPASGAFIRKGVISVEEVKE
jgi:hypothetical protein